MVMRKGRQQLKGSLVFVAMVPWCAALAADTSGSTIAFDAPRVKDLWEDGKVEEIIPYCQGIASAQPEGSVLAIAARRELAAAYLVRKDLAAAQNELATLWQSTPDDPLLPRYLHYFLDRAMEYNRSVQAAQILKALYEDNARPLQEIWLRTALAMTDAHQSRDQAVETAFNEIVADYRSDERVIEALNQIAFAYRKLGRFQMAANAYQFVLQNMPQQERSFYAQRGLVLCAIDSCDSTTAQAALEALLTHYRDHPLLSPATLRGISLAYQRQGMLEEARSLYRVAIDRYPKDASTMMAHREEILCSLELEDYAAVETGLQTLLANFADHGSLPEVLTYIAEYARRHDRPEEARQFHKLIAQRWPDSEQAFHSLGMALLCSLTLADHAAVEQDMSVWMQQFSRPEDVTVLMYVADRLGWDLLAEQARLYEAVIEKFPQHELILEARAKLAQVRICQGSPEEAEVILQELQQVYGGDPRLGRAIFRVGDGYCDLGTNQEGAGRIEEARLNFNRAIAIWRRVLIDTPKSEAVPDATYFIGVVYRRHLKDVENAIKYYEEVVEKHPEYKYTWSAQGMLAPCYEKLVKLGRIDPGEGEMRIRRACLDMLRKHPKETVLASSACMKLGMMEMKEGDWSGAITHFQQYIEHFSNTPGWVTALAYLGLAYERNGNMKASEEMYGIYLENVDLSSPRAMKVKARMEKLVGAVK